MGPYKILLAFGPNLVASEGDEWKRQRKLVAPAFSEVRPLPSISIFSSPRTPHARRCRAPPELNAPLFGWKAGCGAGSRGSLVSVGVARRLGLLFLGNRHAIGRADGDTGRARSAEEQQARVGRDGADPGRPLRERLGHRGLHRRRQHHRAHRPRTSPLFPALSLQVCPAAAELHARPIYPPPHAKCKCN